MYVIASCTGRVSPTRFCSRPEALVKLHQDGDPAAVDRTRTLTLSKKLTFVIQKQPDGEVATRLATVTSTTRPTDVCFAVEF